MSSQTLILLIGAGLIAVAVIAVLIVLIRRRSARLRERFGPEYSYAVLESGGRGKAEADLLHREKHVDKLTIRALSPTERSFYVTSWRKVQSLFVDDPKDAVVQADALLGVVMSSCGYTVSEFEQRAGDISVDHPLIVEHYRAAHAIAERHARGEASTEELRMALIHYRTLFEELVGEPPAALHATAAE